MATTNDAAPLAPESSKRRATDGCDILRSNQRELHTSKRWQQVDRIFHDVLELEPHERSLFLDHECAEDPSLKNEVEALLRSYEKAGSFLDSHVMDGAPDSLVGRTLGTYKVQALLGAGGMGEVYQATDSKLGRSVAIKLLPKAFMHDLDRAARFEREARHTRPVESSEHRSNSRTRRIGRMEVPRHGTR